MASETYTSVVRVREELREGKFWMLTSEDMPELLLGGKNLDLLRKDVPNVIKMLFKLNSNIDVEIRPNVKPSEMTTKRPTTQVYNRLTDWTVIPLAIT
jgi:hypothetical protein